MISFVDVACKKICIDFIDSPSEFELGEITRFFKKYKKEVFVEQKENNIRFIILPWARWVEFLIKLGFRDTANAVCEVLYDLELDYQVPFDVALEEHSKNLKKAKIIKDYHKIKSSIEDKPSPREYEHLKRLEIQRLTENK